MDNKAKVSEIKNDASTKTPKDNVEDKRKIAREEHTNHFTSREGHPKK